MKICPYCGEGIIVKREGDEYYDWCSNCGRCLEGQELAKVEEEECPK